MAPARPPRLRCVPATAATWPDLRALFGDRGACGGCWCMTMRLSAREFAAGKGPAHEERLRRRCSVMPPPGLLGYLGDRPVAWISLGPRPEFARLATSRVLAPIDGQPVWSIVCLFVQREHRRRGLSVQLLRAAVALARRHGARLLEGYPVEPDPGRAVPDVFAWTGLAGAFRRAGFTEVLRRSATRPIFRRALGRPGGARRRLPPNTTPRMPTLRRRR